METNPQKTFAEIGGNFWLNPQQWDNKEETLSKEIFIKRAKDVFYTSSGRGAIRLYLEQIECSSKVVLLPFFTCDSVIEPFVDNDFEIIYYDLEKDFTINIDKLDSLIKKNRPSILYLQSYFGFNTLKNSANYIDELKKHTGIHIVEDITHSFLGKYSYTNADYYVGSIRKWLEIPDGGILVSNSVEINTDSVAKKESEEIVGLFINASKLKYSYLKSLAQEEKDEFRKLFYKTEGLLNNQNEIFPLSKISKYILAKADFAAILECRKKNYNFLLENFARFPQLKIAFPRVASEISPLYFCFFCKGRREEMQKALAKKNIFAPIIWPKSKYLDQISAQNDGYFYEDLLSVPCDQRYDVNDMTNIVNVLSDYFDPK